MAIFGKSRKREDTAKYPREFVGLVAAIEDTPTLIRRIAENRYYMACCSAVFKGDQNTVPFLKGFYCDLRTEARRRNISFNRLREKLEPAAAALGLHIITPDAVQADYYRILGITPDADAAAVKKAYRNRAVTAHPDTGSGGDLFLAVHEAYHVLSDAALRRHYDISRRQYNHRRWREDKRYSETSGHDPMFSAFRRNMCLFMLIFLMLAGVAVFTDYEMRQRSLYGDYTVSEAEKVSPSATRMLPDMPARMIHESITSGPTASESSAVSVVRVFPEEPTRVAAMSVSYPTAAARPPGPPIPPVPKIYQFHAASEISSVVVSQDADSPAASAPRTTVASDDGSPKNDFDMREKLNRFLENYCRAYQERDLDGFAGFFDKGAVENGTPFSELLSRYRENFQSVEYINYRIDMRGCRWDKDQNRVSMDGDFVLEWMKKQDEKRHQYGGEIYMNLMPEQDSFRIQELRYRFIE